MEDLTEKMFISTQGPTKNTFYRFWKMIYQQKVKIILMLCNLFEDTRVKCDQYWPQFPNQKDHFNNIEVEFISEVELLEKKVIERKFKVKYFEENQKEVNSHEVIQLHIICWPDHSVPNYDYFNLFMFLCNTIYDNYNYEKELLKSHSPAVVHCSAGVGRTGTLISIYNIFCHLKKQLEDNEKIIKQINKEKEGLEEQIDNTYQLFNSEIKQNDKDYIVFSVFSIVRKLREQRFMFVTDLCQYKILYRFSYLFIKKYFYLINSQNQEFESPKIIKKKKPYIVKEKIVISNCSNVNSTKNEDIENLLLDENNNFIDVPTTKNQNFKLNSFNKYEFDNSFETTGNLIEMKTTKEKKKIDFDVNYEPQKKFCSESNLIQLQNEDENYENMTPSDSTKKSLIKYLGSNNEEYLKKFLNSKIKN